MREAAAKWPLVMFIYFIFTRFPHDARVCCPSCLERNAGPEGERGAYGGCVSTVHHQLAVVFHTIFKFLKLRWLFLGCLNGVHSLYSVRGCVEYKKNVFVKVFE